MVQVKQSAVLAAAVVLASVGPAVAGSFGGYKRSDLYARADDVYKVAFDEQSKIKELESTVAKDEARIKADDLKLNPKKAGGKKKNPNPNHPKRPHHNPNKNPNGPLNPPLTKGLPNKGLPSKGPPIVPVKGGPVKTRRDAYEDAYLFAREILAREAYPEFEYDSGLYARDAYAYAEPEFEYDSGLYARDAYAYAEPEFEYDSDLYARDAYAYAEPEFEYDSGLYARDAYADPEAWAELDFE